MENALAPESGKTVIRKARLASQALFLLLFLWLFLQTESKGADQLGYPVKFFLDADPLLVLTAILSSRSFLPSMLLAGAVALATVFMGRFFCGWVCPLGTLHNLTGSVVRKRRRTVPKGSFRLKYLLLVFLLASSAFTLQITGIFDPLSLLIRSLSLSVYPAFQYGVTSFLDALSRWPVPGLAPAADWLLDILHKGVLSLRQPLFNQGFLLGLLFLGILALNWVERRYWCRYLCPLGALLGILSRRSLLSRSVSEGCDSCGACVPGCEGGCFPQSPDKWRKAECYLCGNCDDACPKNVVSFGFGRNPAAQALDLGRRRVIAAAAAGVAAVPLLRIGPTRAGQADPRLIRPPGSLEEREFLRRCVKCGECMKVCITGGLQPALTEAAPEGIWSPVLVPRVGYCEYRCTLCGQVCPTGAIRSLKPAEKPDVKIGLAMIDPGRCLPWAHAVPCIVCEEVCPTPKKAVLLEEVVVKDRDGRPVTVKQPRVDLDRCIGCGICENRCPVLGKPAIYVLSVGESRSRENQLLL
ncbi:MAG: (4Fe-4S)-binding protein [Deltaproteobacteria bacterium HGW-Deltaproteobacteria-19]|jgi:polyferredoxin|nr:MAG: (4Fe-4S)-binding protein [Deltaproteobacteria bacterium HGW-Deltaproteobacteria-19]